MHPVLITLTKGVNTGYVGKTSGDMACTTHKRRHTAVTQTKWRRVICRHTQSIFVLNAS